MQKLDDQIRLTLRVAIGLAISRLPWRLLTGAEKHPRSPEITRERIAIATDRVIDAIEHANMRVTQGAPAVTHGSNWPGDPTKHKDGERI